MIDWIAVKQASVTLEDIPTLPDDPAMFSPDDRKLLESTLRVIGDASGEPFETHEEMTGELARIVTRGHPYRIMSDGKPAGIAVTGGFSHWDDDNKKLYIGKSIDELGLLPEYQDKGIGKEAIKLLVRDMLKDKPKWLHIAHANANPRAAHVYGEMGFAHPMKWDERATSLHMKGSDARRKVKEWFAGEADA